MQIADRPIFLKRKEKLWLKFCPFSIFPTFESMATLSLRGEGVVIFFLSKPN
jgi:hypothetical protein